MFQNNPWIDEEKTSVTDDPRKIPIMQQSKNSPCKNILLKHARIFDANSTESFSGDLLIKNNKIALIAREIQLDSAPDAQIIDVKGKTILPGLIDMHTHLTYLFPDQSFELAINPAARTIRALIRASYYIQTGITSIRDVASDKDVIFILKGWLSEDTYPGPRIFSSGNFITGIGGHGTEGFYTCSPMQKEVHEASGPTGWRDAVRIQYKYGADLIKVGSHYSKEEVSAAIAEAHDLGLQVTCDAERFYIEWAVDAGVDMVEHPLPRSEACIAKMAEKNVASIPTIVPYQMIFDQMGGYFGSTSRKFTFSKESIFELVQTMKDAGIRLGIGTDIILDYYLGIQDIYLQEMANFEQLGYSAAEVLQIATKVNAELLNMGDKLGTLTVGKLADIVVCDGKPDLNLKDLHNIDLVIKNGVIMVQDGQPISKPIERKIYFSQSESS